MVDVCGHCNQRVGHVIRQVLGNWVTIQNPLSFLTYLNEDGTEDRICIRCRLVYEWEQMGGQKCNECVATAAETAPTQPSPEVPGTPFQSVILNRGAEEWSVTA